MAGSVPPHFFQQAAAIAYHAANDRLQILLITSIKRGRWIVPKGVVDPGETPREAAARETVEEAGVRGRLSAAPVAAYTYEKWGGECHVDVFLLDVDTVLETWPEGNVRECAWFGVEDAASRVRPLALAQILRRLPGFIRDGDPGG